MAAPSDEKKSESLDTQQTLALIKPDSFSRSDEIIDRILSEGFKIIEKKQLSLTKQIAQSFYDEHKERSFFNELTSFMSSGPICALVLERVNAIAAWRTLMGPTKMETAKKESPNSIRALFASSTTMNACHGSDSTESAKREISFFFDVQQTLALIKPGAVSNGKSKEMIARMENEGFIIIEQMQLTLTKERAEAFYSEHKERSFFKELVAFMSSGPIVALKLESQNGIPKWRTLMGPTKYETAKKEAPNSMRALYASDTTRNACHGSDSIVSAVRELNFFFPQQCTLALLKPDAVSAGKTDEIIQRIVNERFTIVEQRKMTLDKKQAQLFYDEHKSKGFFDELVGFMCSGPIVALKLKSFNAIRKWRDLMGPTNFETAKKECPQSIRALYATNMTKNASHGSDSLQSAKQELEFYFPSNCKANVSRNAKEYTLALIKPQAVANKCDLDMINRLGYEGFLVVDYKRILLKKEKAEMFYAEHKGRSFFKELVEFMCSGEIVALKLERENAIKKYRNLMGPTNPETAKKESPNSFRALYATNMTKNACHGSDSSDAAKRELDFFFPN